MVNTCMEQKFRPLKVRNKFHNKHPAIQCNISEEKSLQRHRLESLKDRI